MSDQHSLEASVELLRQSVGELKADVAALRHLIEGNNGTKGLRIQVDRLQTYARIIIWGGGIAGSTVILAVVGGVLRVVMA